MVIEGEWYLCSDGIERPVIFGKVLTESSQYFIVPFLLDLGADRTVFSAAVLEYLQLPPQSSDQPLAGIGGKANSVLVTTRIVFKREMGKEVAFNGQFAAVTDSDALDMSVLGRDLTNLFTLIADFPGDKVCLIGQRHTYKIEAI
jgi:hypothetical protein